MDTPPLPTASTPSSIPMDDSVEELYQSIEDALEGSSPDQFFPDSELETVLSEESVRAALKYLLEERKKLRKPEQEPSNQSFIDNLTKFVLEKANKIFGILVMVGAPWHIQRFYSNGLGNNVLPVAQHRQDPQDRRGRHTGRLVTVRPLETENQDQDRVSVQTVGEIFSSVPTNNSNVPAWNSPEITSFCNTWQWAFLAPVFKSGEFSKKLSSDIRLPYTTYEAPESQSMDSEKHRNGGFGDVQDRCIHHDHLEFPKEKATACIDGRRNYRVAVKRLPQATKTYTIDKINREIDTLKKIRHFETNHIIKAIASFEKGENPVAYSIIFPWAERGNLNHFWKFESQKIRTTDKSFHAFLIDVLTQLAGVTEAVAEMHERGIRHGDIKPDNILCFPDKSRSAISVRLVVTDVGTSKEHLRSTTQQWEHKDATTIQIWSARYAAPELNEELDRDSQTALKVVPRMFDVWSLGCVFVEFLLWLLYGMKEMERFQGERKTFHENSGDATVVSQAVHKWLNHARAQGHFPQDTALRKVVGLVVEKLLVVQVERLVDLHERQRQPMQVPTEESSVKGKSFWAAPLRMVSNKLAERRKSSRPASPAQNLIKEAVEGKQGAKSVAKYRVPAQSAKEELDKIIDKLKKGGITPAGEVTQEDMEGPP